MVGHARESNTCSHFFTFILYVSHQVNVKVKGYMQNSPNGPYFMDVASNRKKTNRTRSVKVKDRAPEGQNVYKALLQTKYICKP